LVVQRYSWNTIQSYTSKFGRFLEYFDGRHVENLKVEDVNTYLRSITTDRISESLLNTVHSAVKFYYEKVIYKPDFELEKLKRPRKGKYLPTLLSEKEVDRLFKTFKNLKHLAIAYTIYGGGMRLSEMLNIRVQDIYWDRDQIHIKNGKGNKDRITLLSHSLKGLLVKYFDEYQPQYWLFEGQDRKGPYTSGSVQKIIRQAARRAGISRRVTPHTLRHCFATHLLDRGTDIRFIQELLGHKDIKTTLIYTHVTTRSMEKITSPLDRIMR